METGLNWLMIHELDHWWY